MGGSVARLQTLRGHRGLAVVGAGADLPARAADPSAVPSPARSPGRPPPPRAHSLVCLPDAPRLPARAPTLRRLPRPGDGAQARSPGAGLLGRRRGLRARIGAPCSAQPWARSTIPAPAGRQTQRPFFPGRGRGRSESPHPRARGTTWERASRSEAEGRGEDVLCNPPAPGPAACSFLLFFYFLAAGCLFSDSFS